jgi:hypothetical protein
VAIVTDAAAAAEAIAVGVTSATDAVIRGPRATEYVVVAAGLTGATNVPTDCVRALKSEPFCLQKRRSRTAPPPFSHSLPGPSSVCSTLLQLFCALTAGFPASFSFVCSTLSWEAK